MKVFGQGTHLAAQWRAILERMCQAAQPVASGVKVSETQDVVPPLTRTVGELEGAYRNVGTPQLWP